MDGRSSSQKRSDLPCVLTFPYSDVRGFCFTIAEFPQDNAKRRPWRQELLLTVIARDTTILVATHIGLLHTKNDDYAFGRETFLPTKVITDVRVDITAVINNSAPLST